MLNIIHDFFALLQNITEGIYIFGGKTAWNEVVNTLYFVQIMNEKVGFLCPDTLGEKPAPRFKHSMVYYSSLEIILIYGGRNDSVADGFTSNCFDDLHVLNINNMNWINVKTIGEVPKYPRYGHCTEIIDGKMYLFGGLGPSRFGEGGLRALELSNLPFIISSELIEPLADCRAS